MSFIDKFKERAHRLKDSLWLSPHELSSTLSAGDPTPNHPHHSTIDTSTPSSSTKGYVGSYPSSIKPAALPTPNPLNVTDMEKPSANPPSAKRSIDKNTSSIDTRSVPASSIPPNAGRNVKKTVWAGFKIFLGLLNESADAFGPLKAAVGGLSGCIEVYERTAQAREDFKELGDELNSLFCDLSRFFSTPTQPVMTSTLINLAQGIEKETNFLIQKEQRNGIERVAESMQDENEILASYQRIQRLLQQVALNVNFETWKIVDKMATENRLRDLSPSRAAWYSSAESTNLRREGCTPNTRIEVMKTLREWAADGKSEKIYWLNGMAGTGKTTIAYTLCDYLEATNTLAASFFCSRQLPQCRDVNLILPTISYQLGIFSYPFKCALSRALEKNPEAHTRKLSEQFQKLIVEPLAEVSHTMPTGLVVVIDALDECDNSEGVAQMLNTLLSHATDLPLKFFTTSRPEPTIRDQMMGPKGEHTRLKLHLHELERSVVKEDIKTFLLSRLQPMNISPGDLDRLAERSGVLFIYAATAVRYISDNGFSRSSKRLKLVLNASHSSPNNNDKEVDALYTAILDAAFDDATLEQHEKEEMYQVLYTVVCAQEPLTVHVLSGLLGLDVEEATQPALRPLFSVLNVSETTGLVTTLHESFADYIFNHSRSGTFHCDKSRHHGRLAQSCFELIGNTKPVFNICGLESSHMFDEEVPDLDKRIEKAISKELFYACRYWGNHVELADITQSLFDALYKFLSAHLLLWMEIISLKNSLPAGAGILAGIQTWSQKIECPENIKNLVEDAWKFTIGVASSPVSRSTPHIYVSALTFWPKRRPISKYYSYESQSFMEVRGTAMRGRESATIATFTTGIQITWAVYSPDGARIATSSEDNAIRIWDAHTGQMIGEPLVGHTGPVRSVAYSHDGTRIVSGSGDNTICIWDAHSGQMIGKPLHAHTGGVCSVVYSPDGTHIASGSEDNTVRIWDISTDQTNVETLEGHTDQVWSVAYSPDGKRIASGSWDNTIRIWDTHQGHTIGEPFEGHDSGIWTVAYSPDGKRIVSGSDDCTICIWDAQNGEKIGTPLNSHTLEQVYSVAYSPDGTQIASGSADNAVRIWDARTGQMIGTPLEGHIELVVSVAYSSDGTRILSGSQDNTVRIWDAHTSQMVHGSLEGHTDTVCMVVYSPDGTRVVSCSNDFTIRIWDAYTGDAIGEPLEGHTNIVCSVAYSRDATRIVSGSSDRSIRIWDAHTGLMIGEPLEGHTGQVYTAAYSPDGTRIASGSEDMTVRIWDAYTGQMIGTPFDGHTEEVYMIAYSPDGNRIVSGSLDSTVRIWDAYTGHMIVEPLQGHTDGVRTVAYSPDCTSVASGSQDCTVRIWDANTGQMICNPLKHHAEYVHLIAYSPDSTRIASCAEDIQIWDSHTGQMIGTSLKGHNKKVTCIDYSCDGTHLVSSSYDQVIRIWNAEISKMTYKLLEGHTKSSSAVSYSPDGTYIASGAADLTIRIWDAHTGQLIGEPLEGHTGILYWVAYSPDGTHIVSCSQDKSIRIWDTATGQLVGNPLEGHKGEVFSAVFSPDGTRIASGSQDKTIRIWDARTGQMIGNPLDGHTGEVYMVVYSPDGNHIVSASEDCTLRIWNAHTGHIIGNPLKGHTARVYTVASSPDSTRIASGSGDNTLRIWDIRDGQMIGKSLKGHTGQVNAVTYSPDGAHILSGSYDKTVRVWDAYTGAKISGPFEGHPNIIWSIAYSPDGKCIASACEDSIVRVWNSQAGETSDSKHSVSEKIPSGPNLVHSHNPDTHFLNEDGWITNEDLDLLIWIPPDVRGVTWHSRNTAVISARGSLKFDFSQTKLGEAWGDYYRA